MRNGIYIVRDHRADRTTRPLTAMVFLHRAPNQKASLTNMGSDWGLEVDFDEDDPGFMDDGDHVVFPLGADGRLELLWPTVERYDELDTKIETSPTFEWPELQEGEAIQNFLLEHFFAN